VIIDFSLNSFRQHYLRTASVSHSLIFDQGSGRNGVPAIGLAATDLTATSLDQEIARTVLSKVKYTGDLLIGGTNGCGNIA
jgi:hypothetical protein